MFNKQLIVAATVCATVALAQLNQPVFVDTDWVDHMIQVRQQLDFKIVDCSVRGDDNIINFHQGHLPNAIFIDLNYFRNMTNKYPYMLPGQTQFIDAMKLNGIKKSTRVIFYDTQDGYWATRCYWQLRTYGHENASVLNGGYRKWVAEGRRVEQTLGFENGASSDDFNYQFKPELYRTFEQIVQLSSDIKKKLTKEQLSDARPIASYNAGHIDEAIDNWWKNLQNADGTIKTPAEIWAISQENGIDLSNPQVVSCQSGITATWLFASYEHAGIYDVSVYDGSYNEWSDRIKNITTTPASSAFLE